MSDGASQQRVVKTVKGVPAYVYAASREEAQRLLDTSYLKKYRAVPVRWWRRWLRV